MSDLTVDKKNIPKREIIIAIIIMLFLAALDLTILPAILFNEIEVLDINPIYFSLIINQWFLIIVGLLLIKFLCPNLVLNLEKTNLGKALKKYLPVSIIISLIAGSAYYLGFLNKYDYNPTFLKVFIEMFVYNLSVGFLEELYVRGLLLNLLVLALINKKNGTLKAILISSIIFSLCHIPGMLNSDFLIVIMRLIWILMLGVYFGVIYKTSNNLWVPIISHAIINFSGLAFSFTTESEFPLVSVIILAATSLVLGLLSIYYFIKKDKSLELIESNKNNKIGYKNDWIKR